MGTGRRRLIYLGIGLLVLAMAVPMGLGYAGPRAVPAPAEGRAGLAASSDSARQGSAPVVGAADATTQYNNNVVEGRSYKNDESPALRTIPPQRPDSSGPPSNRDGENPPLPLTGHHNQADPVVQRSLTAPGAAASFAASMPSPLSSWSGIASTGAGGGGCNCAPPDTNGAVGPNNYVQTVNSAFQVWNKSGTSLYGPANINTVWSGFGGACETSNDGDPVVLYDRAADRWLLSQFTATSPYNECIAISTTSDPTGSWYRYAFQLSTANFPDYPHLGVWPDGYYMSVNQFNNGSTYAGPAPYVFDRAKMLVGQPATYQTFPALGASANPLLPSDADGATPPPAGAPNYFVEYGASLGIFAFHVDWATPSNSTFRNTANLSAAGFTELCTSTRDCIAQPGTTQKLDAIADRLMFRLAYRNFGDHEALVVNHTVDAGSGHAGVRWYEIRNPGTTPAIYQQGTYAPDAANRWLGSAAMDRAGDIALGYSVSSASVYPSIRYTGRLVGDPLGTMGQGEATLFAGTGSQSGVNRWGDYSSLTVDPVDDCTFWYTNEYNNSSNWYWQTRIGSFKFASCGASAPTPTATAPTPTNTPVPAPTNTSVPASATPVPPTATGTPAATRTPTVAPTSTSTSPAPTSTNTPVAAPTSTSPAPTSTATVAPPTSTPTSAPGSVNGVVNGGFETGTLTGWTSSGVTAVVAGGHSGSYAARVGSTSPSTDSSIVQTIALPAGATSLSFWYKMTCPDTLTYDWATATLKDNTSGTTTTVLPKTCTNSGSWVQVSTSVTGGHSVTLTLANHDDNYAGDPSYTLYDDVAVSTAAVPPTPTPAPGGITNGGFETGTLTGWTSSGVTAVVAGGHSGSYAAQVGSTSPSTDSSIVQTFTAPSGTSTLSLWYANTCPDTLTYDWATATLKDNTSGTTTTVLPKTCTSTATWTNVTASVTAGHSYTLTLANHDDNYAGDPTYTLYDDIALN